MYTYSNSNNNTTTTETDDAPLLSSTANINYSSIHTSPVDYASAADLYEQDNESIRRRQRRNSSSSSLIQHKTTTANTIVQQRQPISIFSRTFWQKVFDRYSSAIYLENKGSVARDHLANERTYLAWLRTSLSTISVGIGITQLFRLERTMMHNPPIPKNLSLLDGQMIGILFIILSMIFLLFGFVRYFHAQAAIIKGYFPASRSIVGITSCLLLFTMTLMLLSVSIR